MEPTVPFAGLEPAVILDALDAAGFAVDGRLLALNSFENRVYQAWCEDAPPVVVKFYRPGRWTDAAILEEHAFAHELVEREIPVVAPLALAGGGTLLHHEGFRLAVYPRCLGRPPDLEDRDTLTWMGRFVGRIHAVGALAPFAHRPRLDIGSLGEEPAAWLLASGLLPPELEEVYRGVVAQALEGVRRCFERSGAVAELRLHGDCHRGNVLWADDGPHFVDLDDARSGPAVQDLWMLLAGDAPSMSVQLGHVLDGYEDFRDFDRRELHLVEALRTLRLIHYAAWIGRRWDDPAFPAAFPFFGTQRYWQDRILELREQVALLDEPPLVPA